MTNLLLLLRHFSHVQLCVTPNLDSILKSRDITLLTKVHIVKTMVFPLGMNRCEN